MEANHHSNNQLSTADSFGSGWEPLALDSSSSSSTSYCTAFPAIETEFALSGTRRIRSRDAALSPNAARQSYHNNRRTTFPLNNVQQSEERKLQKQRFWMAVKVLMRYLKKKNPMVHERARHALGDCAKRHVMNDARYADLIESSQRELIAIVGVRYWERAEQHVANSLVHNPANERRQLMQAEEKLRKKRFWLQVRVLMRYLKKKDLELYKTARATLEDCEKRYVMKEDHFTNLIECVQRGLTQVVGISYWKRAELHVAKHLSETPNEAVIVKWAPSFDSMDDSTAPLPLEQPKERPRESCSLKDVFSPPKYSSSG